ncbi:MAG: acyl-CoA dehydrogenase domain-containing protein, partial [bacterium]
AHSPARERLTAGIYVNREPADVSGRLEHAFDLIIQADGSIRSSEREAVSDSTLVTPHNWGDGVDSISH